MKSLSLVFFLSLLALVYSAVVTKANSNFDLDSRDALISKAKYVPAPLPDGRRAISVYNGAVFEGTIVEGTNGQASVLDASGKTLDDSEPVDDVSVEAKKGPSKGKILKKFSTFIKKYGPRAWHFLYCVGFDVAENCSGEILTCAAEANAFGCLGGIVCGGKAVGHCV
ncbi:MAG: hypothetical protein M1830_007663 [Pleopsidium flavum]|nr:MAG: hypothetical protein M1830_007663 [Pleopsidium flavum]